MGRRCCIENCTSNHLTVGIHLYELPQVSESGKNGWKRKETISRRRELWLSRIVPSKIPQNKPNRFATKWSSKKNVYVCSLHFVKGKPSVLYAEEDIDWAPSVNLPSSVVLQTDNHYVNEIEPMNEESSQLDTSLQPTQSSIEDTLSIQDVENSLSEIDEADTTSVSIVTNGVISKLQEDLAAVMVANVELASQIETLKTSEMLLKTTIESYEIENCDLKSKLEGYETEKLVLEATIGSYEIENRDLKSKLEGYETEKLVLEKKLEGSTLLSQFRNNDKFVQYYTGIDSFEKLWMIFSWLVHFTKKEHENAKISHLEQFCMTLMRLRLNLTVQDLAYRYNVAKSSASKYIHYWISAMYACLVPALILWPKREDLRETMPLCFKPNFQSCVCILDCFEIFLERPIKIKERASTYSNYKSHNTVKYLIAITPQGTVSFVSAGYGGRASDKFIVEDCGILDNLIFGDLVLADRGFTLHEAVSLQNARLEIPAFKNKKTQLNRLEVEDSCKLARVRIHVERVIGAIKQRFTLLHHTLERQFILSDEKNIAVIDKMVAISCALYNASPSVVPLY